MWAPVTSSQLIGQNISDGLSHHQIELNFQNRPVMRRNGTIQTADPVAATVQLFLELPTFGLDLPPYVHSLTYHFTGLFKKRGRSTHLHRSPCVSAHRPRRCV